ncbi:hypothetical protein JT358_05450 [Micrococcales bacterium 31B]|nr:hypothetical protein [Micrococcales bacterium 31B]
MSDLPAAGWGLAVALAIAAVVTVWVARDLRTRALRLRRRWEALDAQLTEALTLRTEALREATRTASPGPPLTSPAVAREAGHLAVGRGREVEASEESRVIRALLARHASRTGMDPASPPPQALLQLREASLRVHMVRRVHNDCANHSLRLRRKALCRVLGLSQLLAHIETFECDDELAH